MLELVVIAAVAAAVSYFVGTKSGKAELTKLKAEFAAELPKIESSVSAAEAKVKADVLFLVAKLKAKL